MKNKRNAAVLVFIIGIIAIVFGIITLVQQKTFISTTGMVKSMDYEVDTSDDTIDDRFIYTVEFNVEGKDYEGKLTHNSDDLEIGQAVEIKYNPENPSSITEPGNGFSIYLLILGPILLILGVFLFIKA